MRSTYSINLFFSPVRGSNSNHSDTSRALQPPRRFAPLTRSSAPAKETEVLELELELELEARGRRGSFRSNLQKRPTDRMYKFAFDEKKYCAKKSDPFEERKTFWKISPKINTCLENRISVNWLSVKRYFARLTILTKALFLKSTYKWTWYIKTAGFCPQAITIERVLGQAPLLRLISFLFSIL